MQNKKIGIIGTVGIPAKYGGFETLVEYLTKEKSKEFKFTVYCSAKAYAKKQFMHNGAQLEYLPLKANGMQSIPYDIWSMYKALPKSDVLLILGVSGCIFLPFVKLFSQKKIIVNIDGLEWKRGKWGGLARKFLKFSEKIAVKYANVVVADNRVIQKYVKKTYHKDAVLIPYGADHCMPRRMEKQTLVEFPFLKNLYAFKVCRIEPENNIKMILHAFATYKALDLVMVGNWENSEYARQLREQFEGYEHIHLLDPIYDQQKLNQLRCNCKVYVHGHSAGGTNPSLVEAMYLGLPILAYGVDYNRETTNHNALYFDNEEDLVAALINLDEERLNIISKKMKQIAQEFYTWEKVANQYAALF